jgi:hypothetical protein
MNGAAVLVIGRKNFGKESPLFRLMIFSFTWATFALETTKKYMPDSIDRFYAK